MTPRKCSTPIPCNSLAVQRLKLAPEVAEELLRSPQGLKALTDFIRDHLTQKGLLVNPQVFLDKRGDSQYATVTIKDHTGRNQAELVVFTQAFARHSGRRLSDPRLQVQGQNRTLVKQLGDVLQPFAQATARFLKRERTRALVRQNVTVVSETRTANGTIIQRVAL